MDRRQFLGTTALATAFSSLNTHLSSAEKPVVQQLSNDLNGLLNLPEEFTYKIISRMGNRMSDGFKVPGQFDGMAAFTGDGDETILIRNHEIGLQFLHLGPFENNAIFPKELDKDLSYNSGRKGYPPYVGGTTTLVYNQKTKEVSNEYLSLTGTDRNCAGGVTPHGTWITCEEPLDTTSILGRHHGYCFEVKPNQATQLQKAVPIKEMGRFRHEAIAVDAESGIVYLTEDRHEGLLYRFIPKYRNDYYKGGTLQALAATETATLDTRNWNGITLPMNKATSIEWVTIDNPESPDDDLRFQGAKKGCAIFARAEGCWAENGEVWFVCTNGGPSKQAQLFKIDTKKQILRLEYQPEGTDLLTNGDNLTIAPNGDVFICEDRAKGASKLQVFPKNGAPYTFAENILNRSELAGACFSPNGQTLFLNIQSPGYTLAIEGAWPWLS